MDVDEVCRRVNEIREAVTTSAHTSDDLCNMTNDLLRDVLKAIGDGALRHRQLAREALVACEILNLNQLESSAKW